MLSFLQIRDYAIVESIDLDIRDGFTCITGETGAGKSILVGALGLLTGQRADTSAVRAGCNKAELTAGFDIAADSPAALWLEASELAEESGCLLRRMINDKGRSRAWINGTAVTLQQLNELGNLLVEIHGQNEHLRLLNSREQFRLLDDSRTSQILLNDVVSAHQAWHGLVLEKEKLISETPLDAGDAELISYHIRELEQGLEDSRNHASLEAEHRKLARAGEIQSALHNALITFEADSGALSSLHHARNELEPYRDLDEEISSAIQLLDEALINCAEAQSCIDRAAAQVAQDPEQLQGLDQRLALVHDLARKHRAEPEALESVMERLSARLANSAQRDERLDQLEPEILKALDHYRAAALGLHKQRAEVAEKLAAEVTALMQDLGMQGGEFRIEVAHQPEAPPSTSGTDKLEFLVSANPGMPPGPLRKVASGGELSRISLAIKVAAKTSGEDTVQVFDEVDAGIGGETARSVGALIKSLSARGQALCVTHLAQVAVFADRQLQVSKSAEHDATRVDTRILGEDQRVDEIARMLGGQISDQSRAHASELLAAAGIRH